MTMLARSLRATLTMLLSLGLLASAVPCAGLCAIAAGAPAAAGAAAATASTAGEHGARSGASHCAAAARDLPPVQAPEAPSSPCDEDCPGCDAWQVSLASSSPSPDAPTVLAPLALAPAGRPVMHGAADAARMRMPPAALDLPPPDVLARTTTLLI